MMVPKLSKTTVATVMIIDKLMSIMFYPEKIRQAWLSKQLEAEKEKRFKYELDKLIRDLS